MNTRLKVLLCLGLAMIAAGLVMIWYRDELAQVHPSEQPKVSQQSDIPQCAPEAVIEMAIDYLKTEYYPDVENQIANTKAEYLGKGLWKVEFYAKESPRTCPRQANIPSMIVYVNEQTNTVS